MDIVTASDFLASSTTPTNLGWIDYLLLAIGGGIGAAVFGLIGKNRSLSKFMKGFVWGAVFLLVMTFALSYFFHVQPPWIDS